MGLKADAVGENDNLAALGIDSMQLMEVRLPYPELSACCTALLSYRMPPTLFSAGA